MSQLASQSRSTRQQKHQVKMKYEQKWTQWSGRLMNIQVNMPGTQIPSFPRPRRETDAETEAVLEQVFQELHDSDDEGSEYVDDDEFVSEDEEVESSEDEGEYWDSDEDASGSDDYGDDDAIGSDDRR
ncbi:hypothetical protein HK098_000758 [Nowakowskiella sp. JEL0407]|nr:hypothetical protein HK098_000758 [Nowakowskiella sp. JEL0407]